MSPEKLALLRLYGAELIRRLGRRDRRIPATRAPSPTASHGNGRTPGAAGSTTTPRTRRPHLLHTGPEIWQQTGGRIHPPRREHRHRRHDHRHRPLPLTGRVRRHECGSSARTPPGSTLRRRSRRGTDRHRGRRHPLAGGATGRRTTTPRCRDEIRSVPDDVAFATTRRLLADRGGAACSVPSFGSRRRGGAQDREGPRARTRWSSPWRPAAAATTCRLLRRWKKGDGGWR